MTGALCSAPTSLFRLYRAGVFSARSGGFADRLPRAPCPEMSELRPRNRKTGFIGSVSAPRSYSRLANGPVAEEGHDEEVISRRAAFKTDPPGPFCLLLSHSDRKRIS